MMPRTNADPFRGKSLAWLKKKAWNLLSQIVRRSAANLNGHCLCYTCNRWMHWKYDAEAGHAIPGRHGAVLFDEEIIRVQCRQCNSKFHGKGGNYQVFIAKLIREHEPGGLEWWEQKLLDSHRNVKWNRADLIERIKNYQHCQARLEKL